MTTREVTARGAAAATLIDLSLAANADGDFEARNDYQRRARAVLEPVMTLLPEPILRQVEQLL